MEYIERYWRDATPADAIKEPPMVARFWDINYPWKIDTLRGVRQGAELPWFSESKGSFQQCQVYDAPDPGEGWRLIDAKYEQPQEGDEVLSLQGWKKRLFHFCFEQDAHYRRRIEQPKPKYVPFTWEDREQLRGRWYTMTLSCGEIRECQIEFLRLDRNVFIIGSFPSDQLLEKNARFLDTGEPVGKRVL